MTKVKTLLLLLLLSSCGSELQLMDSEHSLFILDSKEVCKDQHILFYTNVGWVVHKEQLQKRVKERRVCTRVQKFDVSNKRIVVKECEVRSVDVAQRFADKYKLGDTQWVLLQEGTEYKVRNGFSCKFVL